MAWTQRRRCSPSCCEFFVSHFFGWSSTASSLPPSLFSFSSFFSFLYGCRAFFIPLFHSFYWYFLGASLHFNPSFLLRIQLAPSALFFQLLSVCPALFFRLRTLHGLSSPSTSSQLHSISFYGRPSTLFRLFLFTAQFLLQHDNPLPSPSVSRLPILILVVKGSFCAFYSFLSFCTLGCMFYFCCSGPPFFLCFFCFFRVSFVYLFPSLCCGPCWSKQQSNRLRFLLRFTLDMR